MEIGDIKEYYGDRRLLNRGGVNKLKEFTDFQTRYE